MLTMNMARVNGANPFVVLSRATLNKNNMTTPCSNHSFSPLIKHLQYYSAVRTAPLPPCGAKFKEGMPAPEEEQQDDMVLNVLSKQASAALVLLSKMSVPEEDMAAKADLENYLSDLAAAARKGALLKPEGVRDFIGGVFRLIDLACTEEKFVDKLMNDGKIKVPGLVEGLKVTEKMGKFPDSEIDVEYITSIILSLNNAKDVLNLLRVAASTSDTPDED